MCLIYHMSYEFNNWEAYFRAYEFVQKRHKHNRPTYWIEVPLRVRGEGWAELDKTHIDLRDLEPDDPEEMSIYGVITFEVTRDENLGLGAAVV